MQKFIIAAACAAFVSIAPAIAQDKMAAAECTDAEMTKMNSKIDAMTASESKTMAMNESKMAKDMMAAKDMKGCATHMQGAMTAMDKAAMEKKQ